jgi:hypothetical protein
VRGEVYQLRAPRGTRGHEQQALTLSLHSTFLAMLDQMGASNDTALVMGSRCDQAKDNDLFYLPPEAFRTPTSSAAW